MPGLDTGLIQLLANLFINEINKENKGKGNKWIRCFPKVSALTGNNSSS